MAKSVLNTWKHVYELLAARELLFAIAGRSVQARYKQSFLGIAWAVIQPLVQMLVFTLVFSLFARVPSEGIPYPIFAFSTLLPWSFFSASISTATSSIVDNASLITKVHLPTEVFPLGTIMARGVDLGIASIIFLAMMVFYRVSPTVHLLWLIPLMLIQLFLMVGICLFLAAIDVFYRDIAFAIGLVMQLWMYLSPIAYPVSIVPEQYLGLYMLNPMASIMDGYRKAILHATAPDWGTLAWVALAVAVLFILAYWFFKAQEEEFADVV